MGDISLDMLQELYSTNIKKIYTKSDGITTYTARGVVKIPPKSSSPVKDYKLTIGEKEILHVIGTVDFVHAVVNNKGVVNVAKSGELQVGRGGYRNRTEEQKEREAIHTQLSEKKFGRVGMENEGTLNILGRVGVAANNPQDEEHGYLHNSGIIQVDGALQLGEGDAFSSGRGYISWCSNTGTMILSGTFHSDVRSFTNSGTIIANNKWWIEYGNATYMGSVVPPKTIENTSKGFIIIGSTGSLDLRLAYQGAGITFTNGGILNILRAILH